MTVYPIQATFSRGQLARALHGRVDIDHYRQGAKELSNWFVLRHGGVTRRPGTVYAGAARYAAKETRLFPFVFSTTQAYVLEFGDLYIRFWTNGGQVVSGGSPYTVTTTYTESDLDNLQMAQSGDAIYIACEGFAPRKLIRNSETSWTLSTFDFEDGPYLDEGEQGTYITPSATGAVHPRMTGLTAPSGTVADSSGNANAWYIFDGDLSTEPTIIGPTYGWYSYTFAGGTTKVADAYWIVASDYAPEATPTTWTFEGYDGSNWIVLDTRRGETGWGRAEQRYFEFVNETAYKAYRLKWTNTDGNPHSLVAELGIHERAENQTPFTITASSTAGINGGAGFKTTDVGRSIRLYGTDGKWRWGKITSRTSSTAVKIQLYGHALTGTYPIARWVMSAFSADSGYPRCVGFYKERLCWAGTPTKPQTLWMSKSANYENFGTSSPGVADDAITITMTGGRLNTISWVEEGSELLIGTAGSMRTVGQATLNNAFSATNVDQMLQSHIGAAAVPPVMIQRMAIFADAFQSRIHEFGPDPNSPSGGYAAPELTILSADLFSPGIVRLVRQDNPFNLIWAVRDDGGLVTTTYERAQQIVGCAVHAVSGGLVESAAVIPGTNGDQIWFVVRRTINGSAVKYIEYMNAPYDGSAVDIEQAVYADSALSYSGASTSTVSGLGHLEGETVGVLADGFDIGNAVVSSGAITLPQSKSASDIVVGLRYTSRLETLRLPAAGNADGSGLGRRKQSGEVWADILESAGLKVGTPTRIEPLRAAALADDDNPSGVLKTGMYRLFASDSWRNGGVAVIETKSMYPATIRALMLGVEGEP